MPHRLRRFSPHKQRAPIRDKLAALRAASVLQCGGAIAHYTHTLPGVAADPYNPESVARLMRFKQRRGPFLLLADSMQTAAGLIRHYSPALRKAVRQSWPGPVTLIVPARPGLPGCCYERGNIALRVDASAQVQTLACACGGLLFSSSLNRRGQCTAAPTQRYRMRMQRWLDHRLIGSPGSGKASVLMRVRRNVCTVIRP